MSIILAGACFSHVVQYMLCHIWSTFWFFPGGFPEPERDIQHLKKFRFERFIEMGSAGIGPATKRL